MRFVLGVVGIFCLVIGLGTFAQSCSNGISFDKDVESHLKAAADAQTYQTAQRQLDIAIENLEARGLTSGQTGVFYSNQQNDIGVWYRNLKSAQEDLRRLTPASDQMTQSNTLMRLRETLMDHTESGEKVTKPDYVDVYPNVFAYDILPLIALSLAALFLWLASVMRD